MRRFMSLPPRGNASKPGWLLRSGFYAVFAALTAAAPASAAVTASVTKAPGFDPGAIARVAVVTLGCHEILDCAQLEAQVQTEIAYLRSGKLRMMAPQIIRGFLMEQGQVRYSQDYRDELVAEYDLDAVIELSLPHAQSGEWWGNGSDVKVEMTVYSAEGAILLHGTGTGRPANVVSSPERVAANVVEKLLEKAFR